MKTIVLATKNAGKKRELEAMLAALPVVVKTLADYPDLADIEETGATFQENALIKARATCDHTGCISIGDDSGLEVAALDGAPGIYSARFSGRDHNDEANNAYLLEKMAKIPPEHRQGQFRSVVAIVTPEGDTHFGEGVLTGRIGDALRGKDGFGYDPLFIPDGESRTLAMFSMAEKNKVSHRSRALQKIYPILVALIGGDTHG